MRTSVLADSDPLLSTAPSHGLLVERLENWTSDKESVFTHFGVPKIRKKLASQIRKGDLLIFYVSSGLSRLADIREAIEHGVTPLLPRFGYDAIFPVCVRTKPALTLSREKWVSFKELTGQLSFTMGKEQWRQLMRISLRRLNPADSRLIVNAMYSAK